tara:strand:+ start:285 stop:530 length:246 start_codon:yes stop_codon:yes gene_type:complete
MHVGEEQAEDLIANLKGRLNYETKKATKLGFCSIQEYVKCNLMKEAEEEVQKLEGISIIKTVKVKRVKKKAVKAKSCGCCP